MPSQVSYSLLEPLDTVKSYAVQSSGLSTYLADTSKYLFMIIAVISAFYLIYGGIQYLTTDMSSLKMEGKETIKRVIVGLIFIFSIWTVFNAINPDMLRVVDFGGVLTTSAPNVSQTVTPNQNSTVPTNPNTTRAVPYCPEGLEAVQNNIMMCSTVAGRMRDLLRAAAADGITLSVLSGYRATESCLLTGGTCAKGVSNHQRGLAVDFNGFKWGPATDPRYVWLTNNAGRFGFYNRLVPPRYADEYNHWSTTGY